MRGPLVLEARLGAANGMEDYIGFDTNSDLEPVEGDFEACLDDKAVHTWEHSFND
jgi:hypothetical protein